MRLSSEDKARIQTALATAENRVPVHLSVSVVPASDRYALFPIVWGAGAALFAGGLMALVWPQLSLRESFVIEAGIFLVSSLLFDWWPLRMVIVPPHTRRRHAQAMARHEFAARILASHERRGGVLFFVSLGERYAEIIADRETHARVGEAAWQEIVGNYLAAAKQGRVADGIVTAINACAGVMTPVSR